MINAQINDPFRKLKSILFSFDVKANEEKKSLIVQLVNTTKPNKVKPLHELLLAMMAYPANEDLLLFTERETRKLLSRLEGKQSLQNKLTGTGLLHTSIACNFSFRNVKYLLSKFPGAIRIHSSASAPETQKNILKQLLPDVEYALIHAGDKNLQTRLSRFHSTEQTDLEWLFQTFEQSGLHETIQALLYQQLEVFIHWNISSEKDSISFLRSGLKLNTVYYHTLPPDKKPHAQSIIAKPLPTSVLLSLKEKQNLIHAAKMSLVYLYRETEPFTNANEKDVTLFNLDKGISIALFGSSLNKRYSLESYIGYLVLKNTIPVSYGGGWIFGDRCQFGINYSGSISRRRIRTHHL
jgi:hypothetical protein